ncbi:MAG TPA: hypothetical protein VFV34_03995 [Blastocatellia bacterium]|nr:hypothetical protein [Blastocatellia bacterium]
MSAREEIIRQLQGLTDDQLKQVADYLSFVKYRARILPASEVDEKQLAALYAEFADEDRELAEEGIGEYHEALVREDAQ